MSINNIINEEYGTDKGYMALVNLIETKMPNFHINIENISTLLVEDMSIDQFMRTGFTGIYESNKNRIAVFTNIDENGNHYFDEEFSKEDLISTFLHELIHAASTKVTEDGVVMEGLNIRVNGQDSIIVALNEGVTQMITEDLLESESDAYPFLKTFARQIGCIIGKDKLIEYYSTNDIDGLANEINTIYGQDVAQSLIMNIYLFDQIQKGNMVDGGYFLGDVIQQQLIDIHNKTGRTDDGFDELVITNEKANEYMGMLPNEFSNIQELGFKEKSIDEERSK